ncbi:luciferase, partial [Halobacteriales archaeon QH_10_70_21]
LELGVDATVVDYEGREHLPDPATFEALASSFDCYVTTPVRADGFDPLGDDSLVATLPGGATRVLVAGNPAYLTESEAKRAVAPRLGAARDRSPDAWVGTEGIERLALAAGGTQFELLSATTEREVRAMRAAGFDGEVALYAPTVLTDDPDETLDTVGSYVGRRGPVRRALPEDAATDATATGRAREVLLEAATDFTLVGDAETVRERIETLRSVGVDHVVAYPARGLELFT